MSEFPAEIFVDPIAARRLSCQSVYRLQHLGARLFPWQEETFTELLLGHLTGVDYRIDAPCPDCVPPRRCTSWGSAAQTTGSGGLRLLTRPEEGGNRARGRRGVGADFIYSVQEPSGAREVRLLVQAKRARRGEPIKSAALPSAQRSDLQDAAAHFGATAYYLFYAESESAHVGHLTRCAEHTSPSDTSIVIVPAQVLTRAFDEEKRGSIAADLVFALGRTLLCLDGCVPAPGLSAFDRVLGFVREDNPGYQPVDPATRLPGTAVVTVIGTRAKPPRRPPSRRVTRAGQHVGDGEILWVDLSAADRWAQQSAPAAKNATPPTHSKEPADSLAPTAPDGPASASAGDASLGSTPGETTPGREPSWYDGVSAGRLRERTSKYWRLALHRAVAVRYVAAWADGDVRAVYRVVDDSLIIHHDHGGKISFDLTDVDPESTLHAQIVRRAEAYQSARSPRARNVVGYP
ncbi:hypothetical protein ACWZHB_30140 [Nocardia sp. FBN12]|uniref:hypothetical protein n=1 Tax=Nocardia sp. FBN12 TaxID=3419766 RepID=UPI003D08ED1A